MRGAREVASMYVWQVIALGLVNVAIGYALGVWLL